MRYQQGKGVLNRRQRSGRGQVVWASSEDPRCVQGPHREGNLVMVASRCHHSKGYQPPPET